MGVRELNKIKRISDGKANIISNNGECFINADVGIMGIQIHFKGKAKITPNLPQGWFLQGNENTILIFTFNNIPLESGLIFTYKGSFKINKIIVSDKNAKKINCIIEETDPKWKDQLWDLDSESNNWDSFEDKNKTGIINKTKYELPDYDLPKVETKQIKEKVKKIIQTNRTSGYSGGSGGGGY